MKERCSDFNIRIGQKFGNWRILRKLDEGGFGLVYQVEHTKEKRMAAFKAESNSVEGGSAIKLEVKILTSVNGGKPCRHVPQLFQCGKRAKFSYMIVTLLGENLRTLRLNSPGERMTPETWARLAVQCLYCIKLIHDCGYIHRDVKPANFTMGHIMDPERCRYVHILDFGLARPFAREISPGVWRVRKARCSAEFRGTSRYCSPCVHERFEQGRKDDVWSLLYMLIEMHCGLPWQKDKDKRVIEMKKLNVPDKVLLMHMPAEVGPIAVHLRQLNYYSRPDYFMVYSCFMKIIRRLKVKFNDIYDWEGEISISEQINKSKMDSIEWAEASEFFRKDPIKVNGPPPKEQQDRTIDVMATVEENKEIASSIFRVQMQSAESFMSKEGAPLAGQLKLSLVRNLSARKEAMQIRSKQKTSSMDRQQ
uniref:non-specific serine/threonine protein kinase n=1 Tax=Ascaris suum TaxID=6253 RepID=F1L2W9_ASCSU